jgi:hypothetical protein
MENSPAKLWHFKIKHPVDILIACNYINKKFPNRVGKEPAVCWSWLDMTAHFRFHYSNRPKNYSIVFDPKMQCWIIESNVRTDWYSRFLKLFGKDTHWMSVSNLAMNRDLQRYFSDFYEEKMEECRAECDLHPALISTARRVADMELKQHDAELRAMYNREKELQREEKFRRDNLFAPMLSCTPD